MIFKFCTVRFATAASLALLLGGLTACGGGDTATTTEDTGSTSEPADTASGGSALEGDVLIDGSSTVFPISEAMAEEFNNENPGVNVTVNLSGSGGGFKKFCAGETDISNASRPIKDEEVAACEEAGIEFIEVPVAYDGLTIVVNPDNDWAQCLTVDQLNAMWSPEAETNGIDNWNKVDPSFPDQPLALYGPGADSGTFDYFTEEVNGEGGASRGDYQASEDDNLIVNGVQAELGGLGYFGYAYYEENSGSLKAVEIENKDGTCVAPSFDAISDGSYNPMSRPLFFYVKLSSYDEKPQVKAFADYIIDPANNALIADAGYIPLPSDAISASQARLAEKKTGKDPQ
ncbi:MAG: PstS family phosphate ABC transporter substrate-binding protein [Leptolyngbyaceae bacterium]|nr:PstS family phosphate ABC transporter substrate-binding protein [Leptolyngbyaceae bacterium]